MSQDEIHLKQSLLAEIAGVLDAHSALLIAKNYGGKRVYFPSNPKAKSELSLLIGHDKAKKLCKHFSVGENNSRGTMFQVPVSLFGSRAKIHRQIDKLTKSGKSGAEIAHFLGVAQSTVTRQRKRSKTQIKPTDQLNMFLDD
ncbi:MAG: hypothetical protein HRU28_00080 [Rhizobiales bacterium]|nr:hypothetical protein [Hyphomicrobiales bacterium]